MTGQLIGIARREARRAPMEELALGSISTDRGLEGDHKGPKFPKRQITVMSIEAWRAAIADLTDMDGLGGNGLGENGSVPLPWTTRRANLLVEGMELPRAKGGIIAIADVELEITAQTVPCRRMKEAHEGLQKALFPDWRGGITCRVIKGGDVRIGDPVKVLVSPPPERRIKLPG